MCIIYVPGLNKLGALINAAIKCNHFIQILPDKSISLPRMLNCMTGQLINGIEAMSESIKKLSSTAATLTKFLPINIKCPIADQTFIMNMMNISEKLMEKNIYLHVQPVIENVYIMTSNNSTIMGINEIMNVIHRLLA